MDRRKPIHDNESITTDTNQPINENRSTTMERSSVFPARVRAEFLDYVQKNPKSRRVSREDRNTFIEWIRSPSTTSSSQQEASRKHYVRNNFIWDAERDSLQARPTATQISHRPVVVIEDIVDVVGDIHVNIAHAGWDTTWKRVSASFYGILRADVIFLLKRCDACALDPRKRPKTHHNTVRQPSDTGASSVSSCILDDLLYDEPVDT
ncbi:hypothetical protein NLG97_g246 [Lecanicillium saksenae]|uniref:Uncharacterized protein n=1 Tax=Lecanicillium saksenae TaxID=468837 RepID=A0ACC1R7Q3_9HYPO|nr:hypothetical protein NLG97_g246 [Lecanicillium saksenae]